MVPMSILLLIVAFAFAIAELIQSRGKSLLAWAVFLLCVVHLWRP